MKKLTLALLFLSLFSSSLSHADQFYGRFKAGWVGYTGAESISALNSGQYLPDRQSDSANGFALGLDLGYRMENIDLAVTAARTILTASSYSYLLGFMPTVGATDSVSRHFYFGPIVGTMLITQQNFLSNSDQPASFSIKRFAMGVGGGVEREISASGVDLGVQLQYLSAFGPDQNLGAVSLWVTVGHRF